MTGSILRKIFSNRRVDEMDKTSKSTFCENQTPVASHPPAIHDLSHTLDTMTKEQRLPRSPTTNLEDAKRKSSHSRARERRTSYDSVREQLDVPQSFTKHVRERAQDKSDTQDESGAPQIKSSAARDGLSTSVTKAKLQGRRKSNSFSHLPRLSGIEFEPYPTVVEKQGKDSFRRPRQLAPFEALPTEILESILSLLTLPNPDNEYASRYTDLVSCLQVCRPLYEVGQGVLYREVSIPHSIKFSKFMGHIKNDQELARLIRRLDFSRYSNIGFGRTREESSFVTNVTPETLRQCLELTPNLREFLVHEHVDDELDGAVLEKVFSMPAIEAVDFCACSSSRFTSTFTNFATGALQKQGISNSLKRVSLHECTTLQAPVFEALMPQLHHLTHLDVAHTLITDAALWSIPTTAKLTHLNLGRCTRITGAEVVRFLTEHPAVKDTLIFLNLKSEPSRYRLLSEADLNKLLPRLPQTLRSLNIGGARINNAHVSSLIPLSRQVEELGLSDADLTIEYIESFFASSRYLSALRYIDLSGIASVDQSSLRFSRHALASEYSLPLEVIELSENVLEPLKKANKSAKNPDWVVRELGRRGWYVRQPTGESRDDGRRSWKMGARWWGMRKVPVAVQEVGGMYGFYAFKRI